MNVDLNSNFTYVNITDLMAHIATLDNNSEKVGKLIDYIKELYAELTKIKESKCDSPLCILILTEAIQKLEKEILQYTTTNANAEINDHMSLKGGDSKGMKRLEKSSDGEKKNWMSSAQLGNNKAASATRQSYASHANSSGLMRKDVVGAETTNNKRKSAFAPYQRPSGVIIKENTIINNVQQPSTVMVGARSFNINFGGSFATNLSYHHPSLMDPSKKPRLSWTHDLHREFMRVVNDLGGPAAATPKQIRERMLMYNLTNDEVKSHLQKYRLQIQKHLASNRDSAALP